MADPPIEETLPPVRQRWLMPAVVVPVIPAVAGSSLLPMVANRLRLTVPRPSARCSPCRKVASSYVGFCSRHRDLARADAPAPGCGPPVVDPTKERLGRAP